MNKENYNKYIKGMINNGLKKMTYKQAHERFDDTIRLLTFGGAFQGDENANLYKYMKANTVEELQEQE